MFTLPPHTSHLTQPLDKGCFGPLKQHWQQECWQYITSCPGRVVTRYQFSELFRRAWEKAMTMTNIIAGFRTTGVYPLDRSAIPIRAAVREAGGRRCESLAERTGLQFIPLYSPSRQRAEPELEVVTVDSEQIALFQKRYEEGYDLPGDDHFRQWLQMYNCI